MRPTPGASKAAASGWCKHLRPFSKRLANKAERKNAKREVVALPLGKFDG